MKKIKIIMISLLVISTILLTLPKVYGAYTFPPSINASASHTNLYSNNYAITVSRTSIGAYDSNKTFYIYVPTVIQGDLVSQMGFNNNLKSTISFYDNNNTTLLALEFNEFSGGDTIAGWYYIANNVIPNGTTQFSMTIMSLSTSVWSSPNLLLYNQQAYYTYTEDLHLTLMIEDYRQQAYTDGYNAGYDGGYSVGYNSGYNAIGQDVITAYNDGYDVGYDDGYLTGLQVEQLDAWSALWIAFTTPFTLFEIEMLPGVTIGMIALIPLVLGLIAFIFSLGGKKK